MLSSRHFDHRFDEVGGLDEDLPVAYNDVDFCLPLMQQGYRNVWTPFAELIHHESASRGTDTMPGKVARLQSDTRAMRRRWGPMLADDPYDNPNLSFEFEIPRLSAARRQAVVGAAVCIGAGGAA